MVAGLPAFVGAGWLLLVALSTIGEASGLAELSGVGKLYAMAGLFALAGGLVALLVWLQRHNSGEPR
jgi:hypothetical protein